MNFLVLRVFTIRHKIKNTLIETLEKLNLVMCHKVLANMFMNKQICLNGFKAFIKITTLYY